MKKILMGGIVAQIILSFFLYFSVIGSVEFNGLLYKDKQRFSLLANESSEEDLLLKQRDRLIEQGQKHGVQINKYIFANDNEVTIYTTDLTLGGKIKTQSASSKKGLESKEDFLWSNSPIKITIKPFSDVTATGISGVYYVQGKKLNALNHFYDGIQEVGEVQGGRGGEYTVKLMNDVFSKGLLIIVWLILLLVNLTLYIQYLLRNDSRFSVLQTFGWYPKEVLNYLIAPFLKISVISFLVVISSVTAYFYLTSDGYSTLKSFCVTMLTTTSLLMVIYYVFTWLFLIRQRRRKQVMSGVKGKNQGNLGIGLNLISKLMISIVIILMALFAMKTQKEVNTLQAQDKHWEQTKDIYALQLRFITNDYIAYRPYELNLKKFYQEASEKKGLFVMDAENYSELTDGELLYEANTENEHEQLVSPKGKSITINENYLKRHPVMTTKGEPAIDQIVVDERVYNILVPQSLQPFEKDIYKEYLEGFSFQKYLFDEQNKGSVEGLSVKIIYVEDNQEYFSYNPELVHSYVSDLSIKNPIAVVDTGNLDASFYASWLTGQAFVSSPKKDGFSYLLPEIKETNTLASIQNTVSLYNHKAEELRQIKTLLASLMTISVTLLVIFICNVYFSYQAMIDKYKYSLYLKKMFGYTNRELYLPMVLPQLLASIIVAIVLVIFNFSSGSTIPIVLSWLLFESVVTILSIAYLKGRLSHFVLSKKGEQL